MTVQEAGRLLVKNLTTIYDSREASNIADWVMEHITGWKRVHRLIYNARKLPAEQEAALEQYTKELLQHKPVQYVLHEAWFCGLKLYVDENVLIPRPETEELVEWIVQAAASKMAPSILDVGTGSGCIPVALKKKLPDAQVIACDVSEEALEVAKKNAAAHDAAIQFLQTDFLNNESRKNLPQVNVLVSNPPYVPLKDKDNMRENVWRYEPHLALFVADNDPLVFYRALAAHAQTHLLAGGSIFVEIHEDLGNSVQELFRAMGFAHTELKKDMQGKDRMIRAMRP